MSSRRGLVLLVSALLALGASCGGGGEPSPDASLDTGPRDAGGSCTVDGDCDDGLFCDGTERCMGGRCASGAPTRCDDGVACTIDSCSETLRTCVAHVPDADGDGAGAATCVDGTGTPLGTDCDDADPNRFPSNHEVCDAAMHDEDCDPTTHGGVDADGDGFEDQRCCNGTSCGDDCDDAHASAHPGATEACNLVDDDCDTHVDEGVATMGFVDHDRDGYGDATMPLSACTTAAGFAADGTDCDDASAARHPGQPEFCDHVDNDCDTTVDEDAGAVTWYRDGDGDGFGSAASGTVSSCVPPTGYSLLGTDCNDASAGVSPAAAELCNAVDDDCNGVADFAIAPGDLEDDDRDGIADAHCGPPLGNDCDDRDASSGPGSIETCDGRDNDCDGRVDENATEIVFYRDADGDGFGDSRSVRPACTAPAGFVPRGGDCDDMAAARSPAAREACNAIDDDCDGATDEGEASASCAMPGSAVACLAGTCTVLGCAAGFADCTAATGCETDVRSDPSHCGGCAPCATPFASCSAGVCGPTFTGPTALQTDTGDVIVERVLAVPSSSDFVLAGSFTGTLRLGTITLSSMGGYDGFAARMRSDGSAMWAERWGGAGNDAIHAVATTPDGGAFVVGGELCNGTLCGGPVTGCFGFWQRFQNASTPACNYADGVIATDAAVRALAIEQTGGQTYVYAAGTWSGTASGALGAATSVDGWVVRAREVSGLQPVHEWTRVFTGLYDETPEDLALDGASNLVVVGSTSSSADFGHGPTAHAGFDDAFLVNIDRTVGTVGNAAQFGTSVGYDHALRVVALPSGRVAVAGDFGSGAIVLGGTPVTATGPQNLFLFSLATATGTADWALGFSGTVAVGGLATSGSQLLLSGDFAGSFSLGTSALTSSGYSAFLASIAAPTGAVTFVRASNGGVAERSGGAIARPDGSILWEIEHTGSLQIGSASLATGTDADIATVVVTP